LTQLTGSTLSQIPRIRELVTKTSKDKAYFSGLQGKTLELTAEEEYCLRNLLDPLDFSIDCADLEKQYAHGTREWLFGEVTDWINMNTNDSVMWINAVAGVGKSVAAAKLTSLLRGKNQLITSLFLKYNDTRKSDPRVVVRTISYGLCNWYSPIGRKLLQANHQKNKLADMSIGELFNALIVEPLDAIGNYKPDSSVVIMVDALDECSPREQLLSLLAWRFVELNKSRPWLKLLLTSRPEADIVAAFDGVPTKEIKPSSENNIKDLRMFIIHRLHDLPESDKETAAEIILHEQSENSPNALEQHSVSADSAKTFVWINLILKTMEERRKTTPLTLEVIKEVNGSASDIGDLYRKTFEKIYAQSSDQRTLVTLLSALTTSQAILTPAMIRDLFFYDIEEAEAHARIHQCLSSFRLVLAADFNQDNHHQQVKFNHKSVADYLLGDVSKTEPFHVSPRFHTEFAKSCLSLMLRHEPVINICGISDFHDNIPDMQDKVQEKISPSLRYCVVHWITHFAWCLDTNFAAPVIWTEMKSMGIIEKLSAFLFTHTLFWLECASLTHVIKLVLQQIALLRYRLSFDVQISGSSRIEIQENTKTISTVPQVATDSNDSHILTIVNDIYRFLREYADAIIASAPQVYSTGFLFIPRSTLLYQLYKATVDVQLPYTVTAGLATNWDQCEMALPGHGKQGLDAFVAVSSDGSMLASGSAIKGTITLWDGIIGTLSHTLQGDSSPIVSVAFVSTGKRLAVGHENGRIVMWDTLTGRALHAASCEFPDQTQKWKVMAFSPDGQWMSCSNGENKLSSVLFMMDANTGRIIHRFEGHKKDITSVAFAPDSQRIVSCSLDKKLKIWDAVTAKLIHTLEGHEMGISQVVYSGDGLRLASASASEIIIWEALTGQLILKLKDCARSISLSRNGGRLASTDSSGPIRLWDTATGELLREIKAHTSFVSFYRDDHRLASVYKDGIIKVWDMDMKEAVNNMMGGHWTDCLKTNFSRDGSCIVSVPSSYAGIDESHELWVWEAVTGRASQSRHLAHFSASLNGVSDDGNQILYRYVGKGDMEVWDRVPGNAYSIGQSSTGVCSLSPDGKSVAFVMMGVSKDYSVVIKEINSDEVKHILQGHTSKIVNLTYSCTGTWLGAISNEAIHIYNVHDPSATSLRHSHPNTKGIRLFVFSSDDQTLASGHADMSVKVWNFRTGAVLQKFQCDSPIKELAFSADGQRLASLSKNGRITIWEVNSGKLLRTITEPDSGCKFQLSICASKVEGWNWFKVKDTKRWWSDGNAMLYLPASLWNGRSKPVTNDLQDLKFFTGSLPCRLVNIVVSFNLTRVM
jgi:WD40 repeat protein